MHKADGIQLLEIFPINEKIQSELNFFLFLFRKKSENFTHLLTFKGKLLHKFLQLLSVATIMIRVIHPFSKLDK